MTYRMAIGLLAAAALAGCGQSDDRAQVRTVVDGFYAAVQAGDGAQACARLSAETAKALEQQEKKRCAAAIGDLGLTPAHVARVELYSLNAKVDATSGAATYLDRTSTGWRISALACRPTEGEPRDHPLGCEVDA